MSDPRHESTRFYFALGKAISRWQLVENGLFHILESIVDCSNRKLLSAIYFSVHSMQDKQRMVDEAVRIALEGKTEITKWRAENGKKGLFFEVQEGARKRHKLAHYDIDIALFAGKTKLQRSRLDLRWKRPSGADPMDADALLSLGEEFSNLAYKLTAFCLQHFPSRARGTQD